MSTRHPDQPRHLRRVLLRGLLVLPGVLAACSRRPGPGAVAPRKIVELMVQSNGDLLEFTPQELSCPAGVRVRLTFRHTGKYVSFQHNWVLIRPGTFDAVTQAATLAGEEHGWVPAGHPAIIAATSLCSRGQNVTVEFDAPPAGRYLYICSTPGHSASMWGVLTVTPA